MKRARVGLIGAAIFAVAAVAFAQAKPDFSGTWTIDADASGMAAPPAGGAPPAGAPGGGGGGGGRGGGGPMTVKQTATELTVERAGRNGGAPVATVYKLDGTPSTVQMGQNEGSATTKWDGSKLVITTKAGDNETVQTWSVAGTALTIESTGGRGPQKRVYKKG
ncbi:MAG: hypothetical protein ABJC89_14975 [Acidobacteriota bacterium]